MNFSTFGGINANFIIKSNQEHSRFIGPKRDELKELAKCLCLLYVYMARCLFARVYNDKNKVKKQRQIYVLNLDVTILTRGKTENKIQLMKYVIRKYIKNIQHLFVVAVAKK